MQTPICRKEEPIYSKALKEGMMPAPMHDGFWVVQVARGVEKKKFEMSNSSLLEFDWPEKSAAIPLPLTDSKYKREREGKVG